MHVVVGSEWLNKGVTEWGGGREVPRLEDVNGQCVTQRLMGSGAQSGGGEGNFALSTVGSGNEQAD